MTTLQTMVLLKVTALSVLEIKLNFPVGRWLFVRLSYKLHAIRTQYHIGYFTLPGGLISHPWKECFLPCKVVECLIWFGRQVYIVHLNAPGLLNYSWYCGMVGQFLEGKLIFCSRSYIRLLISVTLLNTEIVLLDNSIFNRHRHGGKRLEGEGELQKKSGTIQWKLTRGRMWSYWCMVTFHTSMHSFFSLVLQLLVINQVFTIFNWIQIFKISNVQDIDAYWTLGQQNIVSLHVSVIIWKSDLKFSRIMQVLAYMTGLHKVPLAHMENVEMWRYVMFGAGKHLRPTGLKLARIAFTWQCSQFSRIYNKKNYFWGHVWNYSTVSGG